MSACGKGLLNRVCVFGAADTRSEMFLWGGFFAVCWVKGIFVFFIELKKNV